MNSSYNQIMHWFTASCEHREKNEWTELWFCVLRQAVRDSLSGNIQYRDECEDFFESEWYENLAEHVGINPTILRVAIQNGRAWRG